jgi:anti-sigma factor RsiW
MAGLTPGPEDLSILLSCYLDGELTPDELGLVVRALESDLDAIAEFRRLQEARRAVHSLPLLALPLDLAPGGHVGEELSAYLDGELTTGEMPNVVGHLSECSDCRLELAALDRSRTAVRSLPGLEPPDFLDVRRSSRDRRSRVIVPAVVATGVAAVAFAFTLSATRSSTEPTSISIADLQTRHAAVASVPSQATGFQVSNP